MKIHWRLIIIICMATVLYIVISLVEWAVPRPNTPTILAVSAPTFMIVDERVAVFGGIDFPEGKYEIGTEMCVKDRCNRVIWHTIEGPQDYWGGLGTVSLTASVLER